MTKKVVVQGSEYTVLEVELLQKLSDKSDELYRTNERVHALTDELDKVKKLNDAQKQQINRYHAIISCVQTLITRLY